MTETTDSLTIARVRSARRRISEHLAQEMRELGADPLILVQETANMSGLEWLERWLRPEIPPPPTLGVLLGVEWLEIEPSRVALASEPADWMFSPFGTVWGGITATLLDTVLGAAVHTTLPAGTGYATTDLHTRFVRAMNAGTGRVIATGAVVHAGRRHATAEGRIEVEATGKVIATGTAGCTILRPSSG
jgi:uncharacterized protein (TIGR00369 family)